MSANFVSVTLIGVLLQQFSLQLPRGPLRSSGLVARRTRGAVAVFVGFVLFDKPKLHRRAFVLVLFAQEAFHVAFVAPVQKLGVAAKDFEGRNGVVGFL